MSYEEINVIICKKNMAILGRNDCFGGGWVEIPSHKKVIFFFIFLHVGNCFH